MHKKMPGAVSGFCADEDFEDEDDEDESEGSAAESNGEEADRDKKRKKKHKVRRESGAAMHASLRPVTPRLSAAYIMLCEIGEYSEAA